ncbi:MAG: tetratricopeptide repeat protein [Spirochaetaceae bacterium]|jgi:tetratricopeptide (TPR) repeat protein|nr:tetratricopeptide repeat protein [Spirochaetaceae bacterium]
MESLLTQALRLTKKHKYTNAQQLLESEILRYRESYNFFYLLGLSYLYTGNMGAAHDHLLRARELKIRDVNILLSLGAVYFKRADTRGAVRYYLEVQEIDPENKTAKKALCVLKKFGASDDLIAWIESGKIRSLYPRFPKPPLHVKKIVVPVLLLVAALALGWTVLTKIKVINFPFSGDTIKREGALQAALNKDDKDKPVQSGGVYAFILTEKEVLGLYEKALSFFNAGRDNAVRPELNKIFNSNANEGIKNKAKILFSYLAVPGFNNFKDNYSYGEVTENPILYKDCYVIWRGMAANVNELNDKTLFEFLVGYDTQKKLDGTVSVTLPFAERINMEKPVELLAKVLVNSTGGISLEGVSVHQSPY